jgi:hypothetical protein
MESSPKNTMLRFRASHFIVASLWMWVAAASASCSEIVYIDAHPNQSYTRQQVEAAAKVYGLNLNVIVLTTAGDEAKAIAAVKDPRSIAIILNVDAIRTSYGDQILAAVSRTGRQKPVMIVGITEQTDPAALSKWSNGAISGCRRWTNYQSASYEVAWEDQLTGHLSGSKLPLTDAGVQYLTFSREADARWLIAATDGINRRPVFVLTIAGVHKIFFATTPANSDTGIPVDLFRKPDVFAVLAPQFLFLHYAAGERAWHSPGHYANLTIDDLWLREPYGHVEYEGLLREMREHNFHTTIAFIPWNFDRSQSSVISLFREHPERFSISVHGNNHDHQEFGPLSDRPLEGQITDIKQGLARMAAFQKITGLTYDPVMIFPHKISPKATLAYLKRYNFWMTVNADNTPSDAAAPADPEFALRPATLAFADFSSVRRYSAEYPIPDWQLAKDAFLGNPMLFYAHESYFASGIGAFDKVADKVNNLQLDTEWRSLGYIAQHLYLEKLRDDGNYDIRLFSSTVRLTNNHGHEAVFFLEKEEDGAVPFKVILDGQARSYDLVDGRLRLQVPLRAGATCEISINYQNEFELSAIDIEKRSWRIVAIRHLSDFRDDVVSRTSLGRWFIRSYVAHSSIWNRGVEGFAGLSIIVVVYRVRPGKKKRQSASRSSVA